MKVKVISAFNDKENNFVRRPVNEVFEASPGRAKELIDKGFVTEIEEKTKKEKQTD